MPAYHEATTPRNRALYERHGYVTQGEFTLPDGPTLWRMWRDHASQAVAHIAYQGSPNITIGPSLCCWRHLNRRLAPR